MLSDEAPCRGRGVVPAGHDGRRRPESGADGRTVRHVRPAGAVHRHVRSNASAGCPFDKPFPNFTPAFSAPTYLYAPCQRTLRLTFPTPKASVQLFARSVIGAAPVLRVTGHTVTGQTLTVEVADPSQWRPVTLAPPAGVGAIDYVDLRAEGADVGVDDLAISTAPQPDSVLSSGPAARSEVTDATFEFSANRPDVAGFRCSLDGAAPTPCSSPLTLTGLAPGAHTFRVATVDAYGAVDASPAERTWTVLGPAPETPVRDGATPVVTGEDAIDRLRAARRALRVQPRRRTLHRLRDPAHDARPRPRPAHAGRARAERRRAAGSHAAALRLRGARAALDAGRGSERGRRRPGPDPRLPGDAAAGQRAAGGRRADAGDAALGHGLRQAAAHGPLLADRPAAGLRAAEGRRRPARRDDRRRAPRPAGIGVGR